MPNPPFSLVFGGVDFGSANTSPTPAFNTIAECQEVADILKSFGHSEFDTSSVYAGGTSEQYIAKLDLHGGRVNTKIYPSRPGDHAPVRLRQLVEKAVKTLHPHKINILYLHAPDRATPFEDTLRELDAQHKKGHFQQLGLSNYLSWEVAEFYHVGKANGWITPSVYQGKYNALERTIEDELIPCLRKYNIGFHAYSPLAGGMLAGHLLSFEDMDTKAPRTRWDVKHAWGISPYSAMYLENMRREYSVLFPYLKGLKAKIQDEKGISLAEAAYRWIRHHSALRGDKDKIITGAASIDQLKSNLSAWDKGPLPQDVADLFDAAWADIKTKVSHYAF